MKTSGESSRPGVGGLLLDVLFPRNCVCCRGACDAHHLHLCDICRQKQDYLMAEPACPRCARRVGPFGVRDGRCLACRRRRSTVEGTVRVGPYREELSALVRAFKYGGRDELDRYLAGLLADAITLAPWCEKVDALVYVPTHWTHSLGRRYYAPGILTRITSRLAGIPTAIVLRRVEGGPHQMEVPPSERRKNIRGKFAMIRGASVAGARICLIDDVSTTGATLNECGRMLKEAQADAVYAAVICKVDTT
ncbi:MAG: double zinc ribbon domain-containing protein [Phycisphaerae bacterium]